MNDKLLGYVIFLCSLLGIACYFYLVFLSPWILLAIQVSAFMAVAAILAIIAGIGYTLATMPRARNEFCIMVAFLVGLYGGVANLLVDIPALWNYDLCVRTK